jgi:ribonuclease G
MSEEILINVTAREVRAAVVENGALQEVFIERNSRRGLTGNIYKGRVMRVLPGMQAAFIDIGLPRTGFLHASDVQPRNGGWRRAKHSRAAARRRQRAGTGGEGPAG